MAHTEGLWSLGRAGKIPRPQRHNYKNFMEDGGPARTRTWDQGIMRASKINNLLIMLEQGIFGTVSEYCVDSIG